MKLKILALVVASLFVVGGCAEAATKTTTAKSTKKTTCTIKIGKFINIKIGR